MCVCGVVSWFNCFLLWGTHVLPMDVPRLGVTSDLHEQASAIARACGIQAVSTGPTAQLRATPDPYSTEGGWHGVCILTDPRGVYVC